MVVCALPIPPWLLAAETIFEFLGARNAEYGLAPIKRTHDDTIRVVTLILYEAIAYRASRHNTAEFQRYVVRELERISERDAPPSFYADPETDRFIEDALSEIDTSILQLIDILAASYPLRYPLNTDVYERRGVLYVEIPEND